MDTRRPLTLVFALFTVSLLAAGCSEAIVDDPNTNDTSEETETQPAPLNEEVYVDVETFEQYRADGAIRFARLAPGTSQTSPSAQSSPGSATPRSDAP